MTRADCWALAALTAVDHSQPDQASKLDFELFHVGRQTCDDGNLLGDAAGETAVFPSPHITADELVNFFAAEFSFTPDETVAIMGGHTLGTLSNARSGFNGAWVHGERVFDNEFYAFLVDKQDSTLPSAEYIQDNSSNSNSMYSWTHQGGNTGDRPEIMLNADMALVYDFKDHMNNQSGEVSCVLTNDGTSATVCPEALTLPKVTEYSQDNTVWLSDFHGAFVKMLTNGHDTSFCTDGVLCDISLE